MAFEEYSSSLITELLTDWKVLLGICIFVYVLASIRSYVRLSHIPGPLFQSVSSLGLLKTHLDGSPHSEIWSWTKRYGEYQYVFRFSNKAKRHHKAL